MKPGAFKVIEFDRSQYLSVCRVHDAAHADYPLAVAELKHDDRTILDNGYFLKRFVACELESRRVIGYADAAERIERYRPGALHIEVVANPGASELGVWNTLFSMLEMLARRRGSKLLMTEVSKRNALHLTRLESLGFVERSRSIESRLELSRIGRKALPMQLDSTEHSDIKITTLAREKQVNPGYAEEIYAMENAAGRDVPVTDRWTHMSVSEYVDLVLRSPAVIPSAWFLAKHGSEYIGESFLLRRKRWLPDSLGTGFTCVRREFRSRGIARHLKLLGILWAKGHGAKFIRTWNDASNKPMLTLNRELGFEEHAAWLKLEKRLR